MSLRAGLAPCVAGAALLGAALAGGCARAPEAAGPPPVVLISLDTFRADRIGAFGNPNGLTPNLDAFAAEAVAFDNAWSQAVQTGPSHASMFTSRYPSEELGADGQPFIPADMPVMAGIFGVYGYQTAAFVAGGELNRHGGLSAGFDTYESSEDFGSLWHTVPMAMRWMDEKRSADKPYFLFIHGYDTHSRYLKPTPYGYAYNDPSATGAGPYAVRTATERIVDGVFHADFDALVQSYATDLRPRDAASRARLAAAAGDAPLTITEADAAYISRAYDGAVSYADTQFGLLMAELQRRGVLDRALVVLMADHGEQLGEHGIYGHCCEVNDEETHVPILVRAPHGAGGGAAVHTRVELVDILPTVLEFAGLKAPAGIRGHSLLPALRGQPVEGHPYAFTEGRHMTRMVSLRGDAGRLTYMGMSPVTPWLTDLMATAALDGPAFASSTPTLSLADRATMRDALIQQVKGLVVSGRGSHGEAPAALRKAMREHGYFDVKP